MTYDIFDVKKDFEARIDCGLEFISRNATDTGDIFKGTKEQWEAYFDLTGVDEEVKQDGDLFTNE